MKTSNESLDQQFSDVLQGFVLRPLLFFSYAKSLSYFITSHGFLALIKNANLISEYKLHASWQQELERKVPQGHEAK